MYLQVVPKGSLGHNPNLASLAVKSQGNMVVLNVSKVLVHDTSQRSTRLCILK